MKEEERGTPKRQRDTEAARASGTQNIIFGSLCEHPRQSLSLPSNCERRATPSGVVEHNLAAAALQDKPGLLRRARSALFLAPLCSSTYATRTIKNVISRRSVFTVFIISDIICVKWQLPFHGSSSPLLYYHCRWREARLNALRALRFSV